ncbi:MAG: MBOAT family protein [Lachnospiraceae bacterium]|nr:MBOAT family protein [Lachnospiraceae bacterium]
MVFSSPIFLFLFLPTCLLCYLLTNLFGNIKAENICLLIFSIIFYAYGSIDFLPILLISIGINYIFSKLIDIVDNRALKVTVFAVSIVINVGLLIIYKYLNLFSGFIFGADKATNIKLPIGISFYTFQVLSYLIDVYKGEVKSSNSIIDFALFTMLFPQLIAGPIVRYSTIELELKKRRTIFTSFSNGIMRFMVGFTKKIVLANALGRIADLAFNELGYYTMGPLLSAFVIICYSMQIYLDFWGYSDMAIGIGEIFGFSFPENFNMPFLSTSISEFWNRWHITLSSFFRDYVYIPLGGSRKGLFITCVNLTIVFALSGFWHGASFNFLFWGLYNALFLVIERIVRTKIKIHVPQTICIIYVFIVWTIGMILFRLESFEQIRLFLEGAVSYPSYNYSTRELVNEVYNPYFIVCFVMSVLYLTPFFSKIKNALYNTKFGFIIVDLVIITMFLYAVVEMLTSGFNPFIYFRF